MKRKLVGAVFLLLFLLLTGLARAESWSVEDLWIVDAIINQDFNSSQVIDVLIVQDKVYLPLAPVVSILQIPIDVQHDTSYYTFLRPGDNAPVAVDGVNQRVSVNGVEQNLPGPMYLIDGQLFVLLEVLGPLMDAKLEYVSRHLVVYIDTVHIQKRESEQNMASLMGQKKDDSQKEKQPLFTVSNIKYRWTVEWEKSITTLKVEGGATLPGQEEPGNSDEVKTDVTESMNSKLSLEAKGTLGEWTYQLNGSAAKQQGEPFDLSLQRILFTYDMDHAIFRVGDGSVNAEDELALKKSSFYGLTLVSRVSPLFRMSGNIVQVTGEAPVGSKVKLYVNKWAVSEQVVENGRYYFKDVLLTYSNMVNEIRVEIKKPAGDVEDIYRYISVSESVLNKGEVNYLAQLGKLKTEDCTGNYFFNTITYWGVTRNTSLGLAWYGELDGQAASIEELLSYSYSSLRVNQRLTDNWLLKGVFYHTQSNDGELHGDLGYRVNLDYKGASAQGGLEYHKEGKSFKSLDDFPYEIFRVYYLQDVTPYGLLEGTYTTYRSLDNPADFERNYEIAYQLDREKWESSLQLKHSTFVDDQGWQNGVNASVAYLVRPNLKILNDVKYQAKWKQILSEKIELGVKGILKQGDNTYILGVDWLKDITKNSTQTGYSLSWSRKWEIQKNQSILLNIGYNHRVIDNQCSGNIPLSLSYNYTLPNDARLELSYQGRYEKEENRQEIDHTLTISLEGAFNFFGGKLVSTSPMAMNQKIGMVKGIVFKDTNRNGQLDSNEAPIAGINIRLDRRVQTTDANGAFCFKDVPAGVHILGFDYNTLPIELTPSTAEKSINVVSNGEVVENLGLYIVGTADGEVRVVDLQNPPSLARIKVTAEPGGYYAYTDSKGYFYFDQLPPGEYRINIGAETLPAWILAGEIKPHVIKITDAGEYISGLIFELKVNPDMLPKENTEQVESVEVVPAPAEAANNGVDVAPETKPVDNPVQPVENIQGLEDKLVDITDEVLKIDLKGDKVLFKDQELTLIPSIYRDEKIWAPIRAIAKLFGCNIFWDQYNEQIFLVDENKNVLLDIRLGIAVVAGEKVELEDGIRLMEDYSFMTLQDLKLIGFESKIENDVLYIYETKDQKAE